MPATGGREGDAKNARLENVAPDCNGRKCRTGKCGTNMQGGKCGTGKCGKQHCMEHCVFLSYDCSVLQNATIKYV